jgi:hypothetical protein
VRRGAGSGRLGGDLGALGLPELVQTLHHGRKTAKVVLRAAAGQGEIWFRDGEMIHAATGTRFGDLAIYEMLEWDEGQFSVEHGVETDARSITQDPTYLLLEGLRRIDEAPPAHVARPAPAPAKWSSRTIAGVVAAALIAVAFATAGLVDAPPPIERAPIPAVLVLDVPDKKVARTPVRRSPAKQPAKVEASAATSPLLAPESPLAEESVPLAIAVPTAPPVEAAQAPVAVVPSSRLLLDGKCSASGGDLVVLVDGAPVFTHGPLDAEVAFNATIEVPAGEHVIVARLEADAGVHEDAVRAELGSGETRSLRIAVNRRFGAPVKLKLGKAEAK